MRLGQYPQRVRRNCAEKVAQLGYGPIQSSAENKDSESERTAPAIDLVRSKNVRCIALSSR